MSDWRVKNDFELTKEDIAEMRQAALSVTAAGPELRTALKILDQETKAALERAEAAEGLLRAAIDGEWQYGMQTVEVGWVHEPRGARYALMRRWASYGPPEWVDGRPLS